MENSASVPEYHSGNPLVRWLFNKRLEIAAHYAALVDPRSLIDIGCGEGAFIETWQKSKPGRARICGIDINPEVEELNHKFPGCSFKRESILQTAFGTEEFDLAICLDTLEHIEEVEKAIGEISRITTQGGYLIMSLPTERYFYRFCRYLLKGTFSSINGPAASAHRHSDTTVARLVEEAGYKLIYYSILPLDPPFDLFNVYLYKKWRVLK